MGAHLQLINPSAHAVHQHAPRVFTPSFQERLAQINHTERELRRLGLHVLRSRTDEDMPHVCIQRDAQVSMAPLLDRMGPRSFRKGYGCTTVSGEFEGVIVSWVEGSKNEC